MHLILTGATGLVGSAVLHHMINTPSIQTVSVLSRRPVPQAEGHAKVKVYIQSDFTTYSPDLLAQLSDARGCVWAQGISATEVSKQDYEKITYDYPLAAAEAFAQIPGLRAAAHPASSETYPSFNFVYVSGEGATVTPGRLTPYFGVVKGRAEAALLNLSKAETGASLVSYVVRPGGVDPKEHKEIHPYLAPNSWLKKAAETLMLPALRVLANSMLTPTRGMAKVMTDLAAGDGAVVAGATEGEGRTVPNSLMRKMMKSA